MVNAINAVPFKFISLWWRHTSALKSLRNSSTKQLCIKNQPVCLSAWPCLEYGGICNDARKQKCIIILYIFLKIEFILRNKNVDLNNKTFEINILQKQPGFFCIHLTSTIGNFKYSYNLFLYTYTYWFKKSNHNLLQEYELY